MKTVSKTLVGVAALTAALALGTAMAQASPYTSGSFAFSASTSSTGLVTSLNSFALNSGTGLTVTNSTGDFSGVLPNNFTFNISSPIDFTKASSFDFNNAAIGSFTGTKVMPLGTSKTSAGAGGVTESWYVLGSFAPGSDYSGPASLSASETWNATQTGGASGAISLAGTFASPAAPVPEPATLALLGSGLAGFGAMSLRRRKKKQQVA